MLWWLLRVMPPRPRRIEFPPTRLLFDIAPKEETPSRTPWWLTALRLAAAALVIFAAAGPIWNPQTGSAGSKAPLLILLDDGWSAASSWDSRIKAADELIANAENDRRGVALVPLSEPARDITLSAGRHRPRGVAAAGAETLRGRAGRDAAGDRAFPEGHRRLRDRLAVGRRRYRARQPEFVEGLGKIVGDRTLTLFEGGTPPPLALAAAENAAAKMTVKVLRTGGNAADGIVRALDAKGAPIGEARYNFALGRARNRRESSICPSSCATTLPGWKFPENAPPARCNCSTSAGAAAPSASSADRPATPHSRCWRRRSI